VTVQRSPFGAIASVQDGDGVGLDHSATFAYDDAGRVTKRRSAAPRGNSRSPTLTTAFRT